MREDFWRFLPTHKLVLATNYEPKIRGMDHAIWSRLKLIPFTQTFQGEACDPHLNDKLMVEAPGILRWLVEGCSRWQREGLGTTPCITDATNTYQGEQDTVTSFWNDRMEKDTGKVRKSDVTSAYKAWCYSNSADAVNPKAFGMSVGRLGVESDDSGKYYKGWKLV